MDFGAASGDYKQHRAGFPSSFFERVRLGGRVLDLGSGTGTLARGWKAQGAHAIALDRSERMLAEAADLDRVVARAEACPFDDASFDAISAGQCWHWFDGDAVAKECRRLLRPGGTLVIAHFDYLPQDDNIAAQTERLILEFNPGWWLAGHDGRYPRWQPQLEAAGYTSLTQFDYEEIIPYSHEAWRGRMRACNGVLAIGDPDKIDAFDKKLAAHLHAHHPAELAIPHRIWCLRGTSA
jgi:SAM-dependent methyltransferase